MAIQTFIAGNVKGPKGSPGVGIQSVEIMYAFNQSGVMPPVDGWQTVVPDVAQGGCLWTRTIFTLTDGSAQAAYSVARFGTDGVSGGVDTISYNGGSPAAPDADKNVNLVISGDKIPVSDEDDSEMIPDAIESAVAAEAAARDAAIAAAQLAVQKWLPAVETKANLSAPASLVRGTTYLCRVRNDLDACNNGVWQLLPDAEAWTYFSDNLDFVDEAELSTAMAAEVTARNTAVDTMRLDVLLGRYYQTTRGSGSNKLPLYSTPEGSFFFDNVDDNHIRVYSAYDGVDHPDALAVFDMKIDLLAVDSKEVKPYMGGAKGCRFTAAFDCGHHAPGQFLLGYVSSNLPWDFEIYAANEQGRYGDSAVWSPMLIVYGGITSSHKALINVRTWLMTSSSTRVDGSVWLDSRPSLPEEVSGPLRVPTGSLNGWE
jgi:hypothetical protein